MAQPRGPVEIKVVTTRTSENHDRRCESCKQLVHVGNYYERVMRTEGGIESYHQECFIEEFGERELYGD